MSKHLSQDKSKSWLLTFKRIASMAFLKPFSCIGVLFMLVEWSGFSNMTTFMIPILKESGSSIDPNLGPIIVGSVRIVFAGTYLLGLDSFVIALYRNIGRNSCLNLQY